MFVATINIPGYLPMDDDPPTFDTAREAWEYLAGEREHAEDGDDSLTEYTQTVSVLDHAATDQVYGNPFEDCPLNADGTGTIYGPTPGYDGDHDLGLAYSVSVAECDGCDQDPWTPPVHYGTCPLAERD